MSWDRFRATKIYLDTNILIFAIEQGNPWTDSLRELFLAIDERAIEAFTSELAIAEVLSKPIALGASDLIDQYDRLLSPNSLVRPIPIDRSVLRLAAKRRGDLSIKLMDAIHVATSELQGCDFFLSADERLGHKLGERWLSLAATVRDAP